MDTSTGKIYVIEEAESKAEMAKRIGILEENLKMMNLPPTEKQKRLGMIGKYDPCPCGSGKKFKFCCYTGIKV